MSGHYPSSTNREREEEETRKLERLRTKTVKDEVGGVSDSGDAATRLQSAYVLISAVRLQRFGRERKSIRELRLGADKIPPPAPPKKNNSPNISDKNKERKKKQNTVWVFVLPVDKIKTPLLSWDAEQKRADASSAFTGFSLLV